MADCTRDRHMQTTLPNNSATAGTSIIPLDKTTGRIGIRVRVQVRSDSGWAVRTCVRVCCFALAGRSATRSNAKQHALAAILCLDIHRPCLLSTVVAKLDKKKENLTNVIKTP